MKTTYILIITAALSALWGCTRTDIDEQAPPGYRNLPAGAFISEP